MENRLRTRDAEVNAGLEQQLKEKNEEVMKLRSSGFHAMSEAKQKYQEIKGKYNRLLADYKKDHEDLIRIRNTIFPSFPSLISHPEGNTSLAHMDPNASLVQMDDDDIYVPSDFERDEDEEEEIEIEEESIEEEEYAEAEPSSSSEEVPVRNAKTSQPKHKHDEQKKPSTEQTAKTSGTKDKSVHYKLTGERAGTWTANHHRDGVESIHFHPEKVETSKTKDKSKHSKSHHKHDE